MPHARRIFGDDAERLAEYFLIREKGMRILARQFRTRFGEIDLVAEDKGEIVFVEVKARKTSLYGYPEEAVTRAKLRKIMAAGEMFLREKHYETRAYRIDVVALEYHLDPPRLFHIAAVG